MAKAKRPRIGQYDETYLACRDLRHAWWLVGYWRTNGHVRRTLECERCGTERTDRWTRSGERVGSSYVYDDGYALGRIEPLAIRKEVIRRAEIFSTHEAMVEAIAGGGKR